MGIPDSRRPTSRWHLSPPSASTMHKAIPRDAPRPQLAPSKPISSNLAKRLEIHSAPANQPEHCSADMPKLREPLKSAYLGRRLAPKDSPWEMWPWQRRSSRSSQRPTRRLSVPDSALRSDSSGGRPEHVRQELRPKNGPLLPRDDDADSRPRAYIKPNSEETGEAEVVASPSATASWRRRSVSRGTNRCGRALRPR